MSNNLGETIREARLAKGLSQRQLAELVKISKVNLKNIEEERGKPHVKNLKKLAECLELDFEKLLREHNYIEEEMKQKTYSGGQLIREARITKAMTRYELAVLSGIQGDQITCIEKGRVKRPRYETLKILSQCLGIKFEKLLKAYGYFDAMGKMLKKARLDKGMSQKQLAILSGITERTISDIERGIRLPQPLTLYMLNEHLKMNVENLKYFNEQRSKEVTTIGKAIQEARIRQKMSQRALSNISGVTQGEISNIEQGRRKNPRRSVELLAKALKLDYEELMK